MNSFEAAMAQLLFMIIPDPFLWGMIGLLFMVLLLAIMRIPKTSAVMILFLWIWVISSYVGGYFIILNMLMLAGTGASLMLALYRMGAK
jgi:hypothetical protein